MVTIGCARYVAFRLRSFAWRAHLSVATLLVLVSIAAISAWAELWSVTTPLAGFVACVAYWCHWALLRDMRLGL